MEIAEIAMARNGDERADPSQGIAPIGSRLGLTADDTRTVKAVIFDMDGVLIDSEPFWEVAETAAFATVGLRLTPAMKKQTTGLRVADVVQYWYDRYPWTTRSREEVAAVIVSKVIALVERHGVAREGALEILDLLASREMPLAIASSSSRELINAVTQKLSIARYFGVVHSAEHEAYGKPHPGVYIAAAKKLGYLPETCLAFEDSPNGILAAKAARMKCIAVPDTATRNDKVVGIADEVLDSLLQFDIRMLDNL